MQPCDWLVAPCSPIIPTDSTNLEIMELLEFVVITTYFTFRGVIYQQRAMGSPVSPIIANLFMEWLEQLAIATAPVNCRLRLWNFID